jgi:hypothetical protein
MAESPLRPRNIAGQNFAGNAVGFAVYEHTALRAIARFDAIGQASAFSVV